MARGWRRIARCSLPCGRPRPPAGDQVRDVGDIAGHIVMVLGGSIAWHNLRDGAQAPAVDIESADQLEPIGDALRVARVGAVAFVAREAGGPADIADAVREARDPAG